MLANALYGLNQKFLSEKSLNIGDDDECAQ